MIKLSALRLLVTTAVLVSFCSCASVKNFEGAQNVGFEHYAPRFYLVFTPTKDGTTASILTLPDLNRKLHIKHKGGWGSVQFTFKLTNGVLTEFGQTADSKGPETLAAVASLGTAYAGYLTAKLTAAAGQGATPGTPVEVNVDILFELGRSLRSDVVRPLAVYLSNDPQNPGDCAQAVEERRDAVLETVCRVASESADELEKLSRLKGDDILAELAKAAKAAKNVLGELKEADERLVLYLEDLEGPPRQVATNAHFSLSRIITKLSSFAVEPSVPKMYEIVPAPSGSGIEFRPVVIDP